MTSSAFLLLAPLLAVSFGYEPSSDSDEGYDYVVQVEPELMEQFKNGEMPDIEANIPPEVNPIRRIRIVVGNDTPPRRLRPTAESIRHTAYRPDASGDAAPSIDLLAQTGPAGGFGRNSTGFAPVNSPPPITNTTGPLPPTVPPAGTNYPPAINYSPTANYNAAVNNTGTAIQQQLDAGFQAAGNGLNSANNSVNNAMNNMGASGQQAYNNAVNSAQNGFNTAATAAQNTWQNTTNPLNTQSQPVQPTNTQFTTPASQPNPQFTPVGNTAAQWNGTQWVYPDRLAQEQSVLANNQPTNNTVNGGLTLEEQARLDRLRRDQLTFEQQQNSLRSTQSGLSFPEQPMIPLPSRDQSPVRVEPVDRPAIQTPQDNRFSVPDFSVNTVSNNNQPNAFTNPLPPTGGPLLPSITDPALPTGQQQANLNDIWGSMAKTIQDANKNQLPVSPTSDSTTPIWLFGWAIAIGSVVTNLFQWLSIVDMRNKYRVALRRTSPGFSRSMAA